MADVFSKSKRSEVMSRIRGSGNKETEQVLAKLLRIHSITGWRRQQPVFGKPDFIFQKYKLAIFVDGCFWHMCPRHSNLPATNRDFWKSKLEGNKLRDKNVNKVLRQSGWSIVRIWEHELKMPDRCVLKIQKALLKSMQHKK
jgi:DNA mismatch endonuclease (patch repair protein)